jgi:hypothetical protein
MKDHADRDTPGTPGKESPQIFYRKNFGKMIDKYN